MLLIAFVVPGLLPNFLVILDLYSVAGDQDACNQFAQNNPLDTVLVDRFVILVGIVVSVIQITRSITEPLNSHSRTCGQFAMETIRRMRQSSQSMRWASCLMGPTKW